GDAELAVDAAHLRLDGVARHEELGGDLLERHVLVEVRQNDPLAPGERLGGELRRKIVELSSHGGPPGSVRGHRGACTAGESADFTRHDAGFTRNRSDLLLRPAATAARSRSASASSQVRGLSSRVTRTGDGFPRTE